MLTKEEFLHRLVARGECLEWSMARDARGYGRLGLGDGKAGYAHRYSWLVHFGDPSGREICHRCDNPPCCNPAHLFLGSHRDNMRDMAAKSRGRRVASPDMIREIVRSLSVSAETQTAMAKRLGVPRHFVVDVLRGRAGRWLTDGLPSIAARNRRAVKLSPDDIREIRRRRAAGETFTSIATVYGIHHSQAMKIVNRKQWAHVE